MIGAESLSPKTVYEAVYHIHYKEISWTIETPLIEFCDAQEDPDLLLFF